MSVQAAAVGVFGPDLSRTLLADFRPEWLAVRDAEIRWQVARLLRYLARGPREIPPRP